MSWIHLLRLITTGERVDDLSGLLSSFWGFCRFQAMHF
jgi:hypothetical protein